MQGGHTAMSQLLELLEARVARIERYVPGHAVTAGARDEPGKLSANEHVYGPAPRVLAAIAATGLQVRYPNQERLKVKLAAQLDLKTESVILTSGSDELCTMVTRLLDRGDIAVAGHPGYRMHEVVTLGAGAELRRVPLRDGLHDIDKMAQAAQDARVLWLPNPHNPTGTALRAEQVRSLLAAIPGECIFVLDEAYRDFMDPDLREDTTTIPAEHPNVIVQRTFSKSAALAGLRVGFAAGNPRMIGILEAYRPPFNVNQVALAAAEASLGEAYYADYTIELVRAERRKLEQELAGLGVAYWPSQANFVTLTSGELTQALHEALAAHQIVVRDGTDLGIPGHVRITVGAPPQMLLVRQALRQVFTAGVPTA
jgi:histidinol-phosphate aminotransferase